MLVGIRMSQVRRSVILEKVRCEREQAAEKKKRSKECSRAGQIHRYICINLERGSHDLQVG